MQLAQINFGQLEQSTGYNFTNADLGNIISRLIPYIFALAGVLLFIYLIAGGFAYMTSGGDPKKAAAAQGQLTNAIIGILIVLLAYVIVQAVGRIFALPDFMDIFG